MFYEYRPNACKNQWIPSIDRKALLETISDINITLKESCGLAGI